MCDKAGKNGFFLLEIVIAVGLSAVILFALSLRQQGVQELLYKQQVKLAAQHMAHEVRLLQQKLISRRKNSGYTMRLDAQGSNYYFYQGTQRLSTHNLGNLGYGDVYIVNQDSATIKFSDSGAVISSNRFLIRHPQLQQFHCQIVVEPVSGRTAVYERK